MIIPSWNDSGLVIEQIDILLLPVLLQEHDKTLGQVAAQRGARHDHEGQYEG